MSFTWNMNEIGRGGSIVPSLKSVFNSLIPVKRKEPTLSFVPNAPGTTLARAFALQKTGGAPTGNILITAMSQPNKVLPKPPVSVGSTFTSPLGDVTTGMRRLLGANISPAVRHNNLFKPIEQPKEKTPTYAPAWGHLFKFFNQPKANDIAALFGQRGGAKVVDRNIRNDLKANIRASMDDLFKVSGTSAKRLHGFDFLRIRKARPNVPNKLKGSSFMINKDLRMTGKLPGLRNIPGIFDTKITNIPLNAQRLLPRSTTALLKPPVTYSPSTTRNVSIESIFNTTLASVGGR